MASGEDNCTDRLSWGRRALCCVIVLNVAGLLVLLTSQLIGPSFHWLEDWAASSSSYRFIKVVSPNCLPGSLGMQNLQALR